jgi:hypothetical protein
VRIETCSIMKWHSLWSTVAYDRRVLFLFCMNTVHNRKTQNKFIPISTLTDATCDTYLFLSICIRLYMFRASSAHHLESLTVHAASSFCVCIRLWHCLVRCFLQDSAKDGHKHRNRRLHVQRGTPDDERLTLQTCRVVYI